MLGAAVRRQRLVCKTPDPLRAKCEPQSAPPTLDGEDLAAKRQVYLVTLPHPRAPESPCGRRLTSPESLSREQVLEYFRAALAAPVHVDARSVMNGFYVSPLLIGVFQEFHAANEEGEVHAHYHITVKATGSFRFGCCQKALLQRYGIASHWSCTHIGYWSVIRYVAMPSPCKSLKQLDRSPLLWASVGEHPGLDECRHEPTTATALRAKRQRLENAAAEKGKAEPRVSELDLLPILVKTGIRNSSSRLAHLELVEYAKVHCSPTMCAFLFKHRLRLPTLIDDLWQWETVTDVVASAKMTLVQVLEAAAQRPCVCENRWAPFVVGALVANKIPIGPLCFDIHRSLAMGRGATTPVLVLAGTKGGECKSTLFKGLQAVFGCENLFYAPPKGSFPLLGLEKASVCFLDDYRFDQTVLPFSVQCLWFDGSPVPVARPQSQAGQTGHSLYTATAPIFVTTKEQDLHRLALAAQPDECPKQLAGVLLGLPTLVSKRSGTLACRGTAMPR